MQTEVKNNIAATTLPSISTVTLPGMHRLQEVQRLGHLDALKNAENALAVGASLFSLQMRCRVCLYLTLGSQFG